MNNNVSRLNGCPVTRSKVIKMIQRGFSKEEMILELMCTVDDTVEYSKEDVTKYLELYRGEPWDEYCI